MAATSDPARPAFSVRAVFLRVWPLAVGLARQPLLWLLLVAGATLVVIAGSLAGYQQLAIGTKAERLYLRDGFDGLETGSFGPFRWTHALAQISLPHAGPGPLTVRLTMFDAAPTPRELRISLDGQEVYKGMTQVGGAPWTLEIPAIATSDSPLLAIGTATWTPPGDSRLLGVALTRVEVVAPVAAKRARWAESALVVAVLALVLAVGRRTGRPEAAAVAGLGVLAFWGTLLAYGDTWLNRAAPFAFGLGLVAAILVAVSPIRRQKAVGSRQKIFQAILFALALASLLLLLTMGRFNTGDAEGMYQITAGLAEDGVPWQHQNHEWIKFGLGQPLATLPLYWLGRAWAETSHGDTGQLTRFCVALLNQLVIPATALVLFLGARRRYGAGVALALTGTFLLATPAIAYARLAFAEPLSGLLILGAVMLLWQRAPYPTGEESSALPSRGAVFAAGLCLGLAVLVKPANAIYIPVPGVYLAWLFTKGLDFRPALAQIGIFALGLLPGLALMLWYNALRYGNPFVFGYEREGFTTPLPVGLYGLLFSPGKGLIYFAPPVLLAPLALWLYWRTRNALLRAEAVYIAAQAVIVLCFYALWSSWEGNIAWGPRLILPLVPMLLWPLGALASVRPARVAWWALGAAGFLVAIPGVLVDAYYYFDVSGVYGAGTATEQQMLFTPVWSQIVAHWRFLLEGTREAVVRPTLSDMGLPAGWDTVVPVALVALALFCLVMIAQSPKSVTSDQ